MHCGHWRRQRRKRTPGSWRQFPRRLHEVRVASRSALRSGEVEVPGYYGVEEEFFVMPNIVILGSGMGGYGAAYRFHNEGITPVMYDKNSYYGGHTASFPDSGYIFDQGPHISFTKDTRIQ